MAGIVTLTFTDCRFTSDEPTSITVNGGTIVLKASPSLSMLGGFPLNYLSIASGAISIVGPLGATFNSQISFAVNASGNSPTITATNFSGAASIVWTSNSGPQSNAVPPGEPVTLNGFQN